MTTDNFLPPDISGELEIGTSQTTPMLFIQAPNGSMMVTISYDGTRPWWGKMTDWVANEIEGSKKFMQDIVQENIDLRARNAKLEASLKPFVEQYDAVVAEFGMLPDDANSIVKFGELRDASEAIKGK